MFGEPREPASGPAGGPGSGKGGGLGEATLTGPAPVIPGGLMPLRPLRVSEAIGVAWQIVRKNRRACFSVAGTAAAVVGTVELVVLVTLFRFYPESVSLGAATAELLSRGATVTPSELNSLLANSIPNVAAAGTSLILLQVAAFLVAAILSQVVASSVMGKPISGGEAWRLTRGKITRLLTILIAGTALLVAAVLMPLLVAGGALGAFGSGSIGAVIIGLGAGLSVFLAIFVFVRLLLTPVVGSLESTGVVNSIKRSFGLIKGLSWRVFWVYLLGSLLANAVGFLVAFPFLLFAGDALVLTSRSVFFNTAGSIVSYLIVLTFVSVVLAVIYTELRVRKEGLASALTKAKRLPPN